MSEVENDIIQKMIDRRMLIFAPKNNKDLRTLYPEMMEYREFRPESIKVHDLLFVWYMRCSTSPYYDIEDDKKLEQCVRAAYPTAQQREIKLAEFKERIPDNIKQAFKRMESFNAAARVENYLYTKMVRDNCKKMLAVDVDLLDDEKKEAWAKLAPNIWKMLNETTKTLESGGFGVVDQEDTNIDEPDGTLRAFRQSRR